MPFVHRMDHEFFPATWNMRFAKIFYFGRNAGKRNIILQLNKNLEMVVEPVIVMRVAGIIFILPGGQKLNIVKISIERVDFHKPLKPSMSNSLIDRNDFIYRVFISEQAFSQRFTDQDGRRVTEMIVIPFHHF